MKGIIKFEELTLTFDPLTGDPFPRKSLPVSTCVCTKFHEDTLNHLREKWYCNISPNLWPFDLWPYDMKLSLENLYAVVHVYTKFQENNCGHCIDMGEIATFLAFDLDLLTFDLLPMSLKSTQLIVPSYIILGPSLVKAASSSFELSHKQINFRIWPWSLTFDLCPISLKN